MLASNKSIIFEPEVWFTVEGYTINEVGEELEFVDIEYELDNLPVTGDNVEDLIDLGQDMEDSFDQMASDIVNELGIKSSTMRRLIQN